MRATGIVRRIDDLGRVVIPKEIRKYLHIQEGDPMEVQYNHNGEIILKRYCQPWEDYAIDWYNDHIPLMESHTMSFIHSGDYTICTFWDEQHKRYWVGKAKRYFSDDYDNRIGKVAAYARAMCIPINNLIGYED